VGGNELTARGDSRSRAGLLPRPAVLEHAHLFECHEAAAHHAFEHR
jgi:hypothetical protein